MALAATTKMKRYKINEKLREEAIYKHARNNAIYFSLGAIAFSYRIWNEYSELEILYKFGIIAALLIFLYYGWRYWGNKFKAQANLTYEVTEKQFIIYEGDKITHRCELDLIKNIKEEKGKYSFQYRTNTIHIANGIDEIEDLIDLLKKAAANIK
jgi:hypothetical protein